MPELPEVETIVRQLNKTVKGLKIKDAWTDWPKTIKTHSLPKFKKEVKGLKILKAHRRAKYIMLDLSSDKTLIIHQKISGHLLYGKWKITGKKTPVPVSKGPISDDRYNRHIRFTLSLSNGKMLGLSDVRRFGKVFLGKSDKIETVNEIHRLGPEPIDPKYTLKDFQQTLAHRRGDVKKVLMDPFVIAGIGNIYSDEILWYSNIHPLKRVEKLSQKDLSNLYRHTRAILKKAIQVKGDSNQDYRNLFGEFGNYQKMHRAYQLTGSKCKKGDGGIITRIKINSRSAHFCPVHQKK